jgi:PAS domain S-box-containing protein
MSGARSTIDSEVRPGRPTIGPESLFDGDAVAALSPDAVIAIDDSATIVFANLKAERLFGYAIDDLVRRDVTTLIPERFRAKYRGALCRLRRRAGQTAGAWVPFVGLHRTGREIPLEVSSSRWVKHNVVLWFIRDASAKQRAEHVATERSALLAQIADGVVIADPQGRITFVNEAARRLLGARPVGKATEHFTLDAQISTRDGMPLPGDEMPLTRTVRTGATIIDMELRTTRPDGLQAIVQVSATPIMANDGTRLGSVATLRDVTAQREFELRKSEFIGAVSHELRTPITVIQGQAQFLAQKVAARRPPRADIVDRLEKIIQTAKMMTNLVNRLIDVTGTQLGQTIPVSPRLRAGSTYAAPGVEAISEVARALVQETALDRVASVIVDHSLRLFNAAAATVWFFDAQHEALRPLAINALTAMSPLTQRQLQTLPLDATTITGSAARSKQPVEIPDIRAASAELRVTREIFARENYRSGYAQPLIARERLVGVLTVLYAAPHAFIVQERALIQALGDFGAAAIDNARVYRELEEAVDRKAESLALLDSLVETAPIGFAFLDRELRFRQINRTLASLGGVPIETFLGHTIRDSLPWLAEATDPIMSRVLTSGRSTLDVEVGGDVSRGPTVGRCWQVSIYPVCTSKGTVRGVGLVMVDITQRKRAEAEHDRLLNDEQKARQQAEGLAAERAAILGHIADGVLLVDAYGYVTFQNEAARQMIGEAPIGTYLPDFTKVIHLSTPEGRPYAPRALLLVRALRQKETNIRVEQHVHPPQKPPIILESSAAPVLGEDGKQIGAVLSLRDITTQRELERERDALYSAATHDLKNPLTVILGRAQQLERRAQRSELAEMRQLVPAFETLAMSAKRAVLQIDELLDVTRARSGHPSELHCRPTDLMSLLRQVIAEYQTSTNLPRIQLISKVSEVIGCWDSVRLERLFSNLLSNAIKYSPARGEVVVDVRVLGKSTNRWVNVRVRDHGMGIPATDLPYIFEPFRRATNVSARIVGWGIGLTSARYIAQQHGGTITAQSEEGVGSTFSVRLPLNIAGAVATH